MGPREVTLTRTAKRIITGLTRSSASEARAKFITRFAISERVLGATCSAAALGLATDSEGHGVAGL
jgi:hypothetical protein